MRNRLLGMIFIAGLLASVSGGLNTAMLLAQETTATISGAVKDGSGAVIPEAAVRVRNVATGVARSVQTDNQGRYSVTQLLPGNYELETSMAGFQNYLRTGIELTVGRHAVVDVDLQVGEVTQTVEVAGEVPLVETTSASLSGIVSEKQIRDLPLNGRDFVSLSLMEPGVVQARSAAGGVATGAGLQLSFNGARSRMNNFLMDGTSINSINGMAIGGASGQALGVDTIQEFQVITSNFSAEFGRAGGGVINVVSKAGTNELHGSVFEFFRNDAIDSRRWEDNALANGRKSPLRKNQFGGTLGGPISSDKTFIFGGYEGMRQRVGNATSAFIPSVAMRQGNLPLAGAACTAAPISGTQDGANCIVPISEIVRPYLALWPDPTPGRPILADGRGEYIRSFSVPTNQDYVQVRVDHNFSEGSSLFARYTIDDSSRTTPQPLPTYDQMDSIRNQYATIGETHIFSPQMLNVFRFGFNRPKVGYTTETTNPLLNNEALWFIPNAPSPGVGPLGITGIANPTLPNNLPRTRLDNVYQLTDTMSYTSGNHAIKFGVDFQRIQTNENDVFRGIGLFTFASMANFLRNIPATFTGVTPGGTAVRGWRQNIMGLFVQDDMKPFQGLTLNLGVRWEFQNDPTEVNGRASHYDGLFTTDTLVVTNPVIKLPIKNFSPRIGFAWDATGDGKTSIRGGYGLYYQMIFRDYFYANRTLPPFFTTKSAQSPSPLLTFPHPVALFSAPGAVFNDGAQWDNNKQTYMMQWNMSIQREILPNTLLGVSYVGTRGLFLNRQGDLNTAVPTILPDGRYYYAPVNGAAPPRRDANFTSTSLRTLSASSTYHGLQTKMTTRFSQSLQAQFAYSWSHVLDNAVGAISGDFQQSSSPQNPYTMNSSEWGHAAFDLRHVVSANYTYTLPFGNGLTGILGKLLSGWQTNGILSLTTGVPFTVINSATLNTVGRDQSASAGSNLSRPDLAPGMSSNPTSGTTAGCAGVAAGQQLGTPDLYYDPCAFRLQDLGFYGNLGRDTLIGPKFRNFDFALVKNTSLGENKSLQFRWEVFNIFNHPNFGLPNNTNFLATTGAANAQAGRITTTANDPRQMQFGLKISF